MVFFIILHSQKDQREDSLHNIRCWKCGSLICAPQKSRATKPMHIIPCKTCFRKLKRLLTIYHGVEPSKHRKSNININDRLFFDTMSTNNSNTEQNPKKYETQKRVGILSIKYTTILIKQKQQNIAVVCTCIIFLSNYTCIDHSSLVSQQVDLGHALPRKQHKSKWSNNLVNK